LEYKVFILSTRAGGLGLNLQTAIILWAFQKKCTNIIRGLSENSSTVIGILTCICKLRIEHIVLVRQKLFLSCDSNGEEHGRGHVSPSSL
jgi:hypothetical protein